jgi:hypothetical protein
LAITKTRELELMSKVADNWQNKLVDANKLIEDIHNENTILGKRLNNWKTGVIKSLKNTFREENYPKELQREIKMALAKKYPGIFEVSK